jgi:hypothetical protein
MDHVLDQLMWTFVAGELPSENGFKCRWCDCFIGISDPEQLDMHLDNHVSVAIENWQPGSKSVFPLFYLNEDFDNNRILAIFQCGVYGCGLQCVSADDLRSHIKHHYYHAVTQREGLKLLRQNLTTLMKLVS